jgi:hypothetical protein
MLGMETVAERMADYLVGHHPPMPSIGKTVQALVTTRGLEDSMHALHNDNVPYPWQPVAAVSSAGVNAVTLMP